MTSWQNHWQIESSLQVGWRRVGINKEGVKRKGGGKGGVRLMKAQMREATRALNGKGAGGT